MPECNDKGETSTSSSGGYDISSLLTYAGPSLSQQDPIVEGVDLLDFRNSDANLKNISTILSALGITFNIQQPTLGWKGTQIRMVVRVPTSQSKHAMQVLTAAAGVGAVEIVPGTEGIINY